MTHVCMVSNKGCVRVGKETTALLTKGVKVSSISAELPKWSDRFDSTTLCSSKEQYISAVTNSKADIFHVHNMPDWMVGITKGATDRPVVYDVHDPEIMRIGVETSDEIEAHAVCDATVYPSNTCQKFVENHYKKTKPSIVLFSYINEMYDKYKPLDNPSWDTVVYEGGIVDDPRSPNFYRDLFKAYQKFGFNVLLFPSGWAETAKNYANQVAMLGPVSYETLLMTIRSCGFGILGTQQLNDAFFSAGIIPKSYAAMPNKLFEYIHAGCVPMIYNMGEASEYVETRHIGLDMTVLAGKESKGLTKNEMIVRGMECRKALLALRPMLYLEDHIQPLIDLYNSL